MFMNGNFGHYESSQESLDFSIKQFMLNVITALAFGYYWFMVCIYHIWYTYWSRLPSWLDTEIQHNCSVVLLLHTHSK